MSSVPESPRTDGFQPHPRERRGGDTGDGKKDLLVLTLLRRGPALEVVFLSQVLTFWSIRRPCTARTRFTFASRPLAVGQSCAARQDA
eukprot:scaffold115340_cov18-Phaeocystis_antarctica.AAC.1